MNVICYDRNFPFSFTTLTQQLFSRFLRILKSNNIEPTYLTVGKNFSLAWNPTSLPLIDTYVFAILYIDIFTLLQTYKCFESIKNQLTRNRVVVLLKTYSLPDVTVEGDFAYNYNMVICLREQPVLRKV